MHAHMHGYKHSETIILLFSMQKCLKLIMNHYIYLVSICILILLCTCLFCCDTNVYSHRNPIHSSMYFGFGIDDCLCDMLGILLLYKIWW